MKEIKEQEKKDGFLKRLGKRIKDKTNKRNRADGQVATALAGALSWLFTSGYVDANPKAKAATGVGVLFFGYIAGRNMLTKGEDLNPKKD